MIRRRILLSIFALAAVFDGAFFAHRYYRAADKAATIIYVGIDSLGLIAPASTPTLTLKDGAWTPGLKTNTKAKVAVEGMGRKGVLFLVSLAPRSDYGSFIDAVADLKRRGICNVAIRDGATPFKSDAPLEDGSRDGVAIAPTLVLCGTAIGDAGFAGALPPDKKIQL